ncbi:MAG: hypothetical protein BRC23_01175 [Parcubacteria group bacterium SW_4_49_11]|nr:MAG: hypothetical protein BRC23_01175 [Parcubacteria group bacterium SW_4_49_11]
MDVKHAIAGTVGSVGILFLLPITVQAQESERSVGEVRDEYEQVVEQAESLEEQKTDIEKELESYNQKIENLSEDIEQTDKSLSEVKDDLKATKEKIQNLKEDIENQKRLIKEYLATLHTEEGVSAMRMIFSNKNLSDLVGKIENVNTIQSSLRERIRIVEKNKKQIRSAKEHMFAKERELENKKRRLTKQKNLRENNKRQKKQLLSDVNSDLSKKRQRKEKLASEIDALTGAQEEEAVSIKEAYEQAELISSKLHNKISPAYLTAVLMVESGSNSTVGHNFGSSYYKDAMTRCKNQEGNGTSIPAKRQEDAFENIVNTLGLSVNKKVSSCPYPSYQGIGGAMGYAQFLPTTWMSWASIVKKYNSGEELPNPWNLEDAMLAAAVKLTNANPSIEHGDDLTSNQGLRRQRALQYLGGGSHGWYANHISSSMKRVKRLMGDTEDNESSTD